MYENSRVAVIIAAAGKGSRMGSEMPKQFIDIGGQPMLVKTLQAFEDIDEIDDIFIVTGGEFTERCERLIEEYRIGKVSAVVSGGSQRQDSVFNALREIDRCEPDTEYVLIHDAARPFIKREVILDVLKAAAKTGAATACVAMKDSLRRFADERGTGTGSVSVDRSSYFAVQTPQGFRRDCIMTAYRKALGEGVYATDDATLAERAGYEVAIVEGDYGNIKITTKEDLPMENRVGTGFDVHGFAEDRKLILGGVDIPYDKGLDGHSDADVLVHALMDALLGAAALGDIGRLFPDTEAEYEGISSILLLERVGDMLSQSMYRIGNIDVTVIAQAPKINRYTEQMRDNIADALKLDKSRINIKGTTTEKLGFVGREEGIAAEAVCSLYR